MRTFFDSPCSPGCSSSCKPFKSVAIVAGAAETRASWVAVCKHLNASVARLYVDVRGKTMGADLRSQCALARSPHRQITQPGPHDTTNHLTRTLENTREFLQQ